MTAKFILSNTCEQYAVTDLIDLLAKQSAVHAADADRNRAIADMSLSAWEDESVKVDVDSRAQVESRIKIRRLTEERIWSRRVSIGIQTGALIARDDAGHPCRPKEQVLNLFVTHDDVVAWLQGEHYTVEVASANVGPAWKVKRSQRSDALTPMIEAALLAMHDAGQLKPPTAKQVVNWIEEHKPFGFLRVSKKNGLARIEYLNNNGSEDHVDIDAIDQRIRRAIEKQPSV